MNSRLFTGWVRHRRYAPKAHSFNYPTFMTWLDLAELSEVFVKSRFWSLERFNLVGFRRSDYLGAAEVELSEAVKAKIKHETGEVFNGRICLLTHLRYLGYCFNPVSFYFCYPEQSEQPRFILAEINNTPWDERFCYVLDTHQSQNAKDKWTFEFDKNFHVSPFMPMQLGYRWLFSLHNEQLTIHMQLFDDQDCCFDATLQMQAQALNDQAMRTIPLSYPLLTFKVVWLIYWQALLLWLKGIPVFDHPNKQVTK